MTRTDDLAYATIADIASDLASGQVSPVELTRACLDRIQRLEPRINAFITVLADEALAEARQAEQDIQRGQYRGPLHGIPIAHKDLYLTRGVRTTAGSKVLADFVPTEDAAAVARLRQAGTILLGKTNLHELAAGGTTNNPHYGATRNPWALDCHPGGSSGGSAAALAAGMCLGATGSDTAASIRQPSAHCGTTGIKPTYGRVSCYGVVPLSWSLDHAGPMARSAQDAALLLNAMAGFDRRDPASVDRPVEDFTASLDHGIENLRLGVPVGYFTEQVQADVTSAWRQAIDALVGLGARPIEVDCTGLQDAPRIGMTLVRIEMLTYHQRWFAERPEAYSPDLRERFAAWRDARAVDYVEAQRAREPIRATLWSVFDQVDVLVTPTSPITTSPIGEDTVDINGEPQPLATHAVRFTYPFNVTGFPALSVPCGFDRHGRPIGLQLAAPSWHEALLFRVGHAYQQATDWHARRPDLRVAA